MAKKMGAGVGFQPAPTPLSHGAPWWPHPKILDADPMAYPELQACLASHVPRARPRRGRGSPRPLATAVPSLLPPALAVLCRPARCHRAPWAVRSPWPRSAPSPSSRWESCPLLLALVLGVFVLFYVLLLSSPRSPPALGFPSFSILRAPAFPLSLFPFLFSLFFPFPIPFSLYPFFPFPPFLFWAPSTPSPPKWLRVTGAHGSDHPWGQRPLRPSAHPWGAPKCPTACRLSSAGPAWSPCGPITPGYGVSTGSWLLRPPTRPPMSPARSVPPHPAPPPGSVPPFPNSPLFFPQSITGAATPRHPSPRGRAWESGGGPTCWVTPGTRVPRGPSRGDRGCWQVGHGKVSPP